MRKLKHQEFIVWAIFAVVALGGVAYAQTGLATIRGIAQDGTGAVLPGLDVTVREVGTSVPARIVVTNDSGNYEIPDLKPGTYRLTAELPGFKTFVADNIILGSGEVRRVNITLQLGEISEQVTVTLGAETITTDSGGITEAFGQANLKDTSMPASYPSPFAVMSTLPGIQGRGWQVKISGQDNSQMSAGFDGLPNDLTGGQSNNLNFFQEITVQAVNATAEQSRVGSYNMTSKSGTNDFSGMAYYKHYNSGLEARKFFDPRRTPFIQHEWQIEAAGPIIRDKTYFYGSWMAQVFPLGSFTRSTVPTDLMRQGDFSEIGDTIINPYTGEPFPNNVIPIEMQNPTSLKTQDLYISRANFPGLSNNYGFDFAYPSDLFRGDWPFVRIDQVVTENNTLYGRWLLRRTPYVLSRAGGPQFAWTRVRNHHQTIVSDTHVFSPGLVNTFKFGWVYDSMVDGNTIDGNEPIKGNDAVNAIGLQGVNPNNLNEQGFPRHDWSGFSSIETVNGGVRADNHNFNLDNGTTWSFGRHTMKFGAQMLILESFNGLVPNDTYGRFRFDGRFTGHSYADFLLGLPYRSQRLNPFTDRLQNMNEVGIYVTDTFKVNSEWTIDWGLRWDRYSTPTYDDGLQYNWDPSSGNVIIAQDAMSQISPLYPSNIPIAAGDPVPAADNGNFRPRIGVAYRMSDTVVIRGGYGAFTERIGYFDRVLGGGPFEIGEDYRNVFENGQPLFTFPNPFPGDLGQSVVPSQSITGFPTETDEGLIHQFNVSVEKRVLDDVGLRFSYVGSRNRGMNYGLNINKPEPSLIDFDQSRRPFPQFVGATFYREDGGSNYDSFQVQAEKKVGEITYNVHWTWANNMINYLNRENPYDVTSHWARDATTRRHRVVGNLTWDLPWGQGRRYLSDASGAVEQILGGWRAQWVSILATGEYFNPSFSGSDPSNTDTNGGLPDRIGDGNLSNPKVEQWFDPSAFAVPAEGRFGNSGINILEGQGMNVHHLSLAKSFPIAENYRLTLTTAMSNLFNKPHFNSIRTNISSSDPGRYTSVHSEFWAEKASHRRIVMKLRLEF